MPKVPKKLPKVVAPPPIVGVPDTGEPNPARPTVATRADPLPESVLRAIRQRTAPDSLERQTVTDAATFLWKAGGDAEAIRARILA